VQPRPLERSSLLGCDQLAAVGRTTVDTTRTELPFCSLAITRRIGQPGAVRSRLLARLLLVTLTSFFSGCSTNHSRATETTTAVSEQSTTARLMTCKTPTRFGVGSTRNEVRGVSSDASLWGLALGRVPPHAGDELKIVWRMTGTGALRVRLTTPDGNPQPLTFGPQRHAASTYHRPGEEWGTAFRFGSAGCWHIHLARTDSSGDVWIDVRA
jgi:hypothetical protein